MHSLRTRINLFFVLPTVVIVVVLVVVAYIAAREGLEEELGQRLQSVASVIAVDLSEGIDAAQIERMEGSMERVRGRLHERLEAARVASEVERILVFDAEGRRLLDTADEEGFGETVYRVRADQREVALSFEEQQGATGPLFRRSDGGFHKVAYAPITLEGRTVAAVAVEASATYFSLLRWFAMVLGLLGVAGVAIVIGIGAWFSRVLVRPVDQLVGAAKDLGEGDYEVTLMAPESAGSRELEILVEAFDEMRGSIVERDERMKLMLAGIAHEVRNPLGGIELFCGLLRDDLRSLDEGEQREAKLRMVERIQREVGYLNDVVDGFLDFATESELTLQRVSLEALAEEVEAILRPALDAAGCRWRVGEGQELVLTVDRERFRRALINVGKNAVQACGEGDEVILEAWAEDGGHRVVLRDTGCGVERATIDRLSQPFFTTREQGSGLGLALTKQVIEDHDGRMEIESEVGEGTTLRFWLPYDEDAGGESSEEEERSIPEGWLG